MEEVRCELRPNNRGYLKIEGSACFFALGVQLHLEVPSRLAPNRDCSTVSYGQMMGQRVRH